MVFLERTDLELTLRASAQCFIWREEGGVFSASPSGHPLALRQAGEGVEVASGDAAFARYYLDLGRDYDALLREYGDVPCFPEAYRALRGLRVLRQEPWEALVQFILSANNNVRRIASTVRALGEAAAREGRSIPSPAFLAQAGEEYLRRIGAGYRAPYLIGAARMVAEGFSLEKAASLPYEDARKKLMELPGVGDKVANCVLLFGLGRTDAFPVDTWMEKLLAGRFGCAGLPREEMAREARRRFGKDAGLLQQYMFHAVRTGSIAEKEDRK